MTYNNTPLTASVKLAYETRGRGTPLLLLHGYPLDHSIWHEQASALQSKCQVITPDLRGHGNSPAPEGRYSMDLMARDVLLLLDTLQIEKAVWVGHSMGGYITLAAWRMAPERFSGFGMVASNYLADSAEAKEKRYETAEKVSQLGAEVAVNPKLFLEGTPAEAPEVEHARRIMLNTAPAGIIGSLLAIAERPDSTETLKTINVPALVIGGTGDQLFKPEIPKQIASLIPGAELVMAEKSGHMPMMEEAALVTEALKRLVERAK